jgi:hypothetical protein
LTIDAMDVSGEQQIDLDHNIWKKRLGPDGNPLAVEKEAGTWHVGACAALTLS